MPDATAYKLRQVLELPRVIGLVGLAVLAAVACGDKFTGVDPGTAGAGGGGGSVMPMAGSNASGEPAVDGGADSGGTMEAGGADSAGRGGRATVGGADTAGSGGSLGGGGAMAGSGGSGGVVVEPPVPLDGLELWYDAQTGVGSVNGVVASWKDRSGHGRDALQTAVNYRPKFVNDAFAGKAGIVFDGEDDYLKVPALPGDFSHGMSIFFAGQQETNPDSCTAFFEASNDAEVNDVHLGVWDGVPLYEVLENIVHPVDHPILLGQPELLAVVHQATRAVQMRRNSAGLGEGTFDVPETIPREQVFIGRSLYGGCQTFHGSVAELLVYNRGVTDPELVAIESYLQTKWTCCAD